jgi:hypothetical protein
MEAFYTGLNYLRDQEYDFVVKLDCDLSFNAYYFEDLFKEFHSDEKLGIASGQTFFLNPKGELNRLGSGYLNAKTIQETLQNFFVIFRIMYIANHYTKTK